MQPHFRISHFAFDFAFWCQGCHRVNHDDVNRTRADQVFGNLECLFTVVGLRNDEVFYVYVEFFGIIAIKGMLGIDKGCDTASFLRLRNGV